VRLQFHDVRLPLADFDLEITAELSGLVTGIFGPSGAGKTSLLDTVAGLRLPRSGRVVLDGLVLDDAEAGIHIAARHRGIGYVPQENALFPHMTVLQNIRYGAGHDPTHPIERVVDVLEIGPLLGRGVRSLSGGEQKRVAVARALVTSPRLLLLDEPLSGIDRPLQGRILAFLRRIRDDFRLPMLYVTHDSSELAEIAETVAVLDRGRIVTAGPTAEVRT
jgi:molybdate transport system ATP-binding protein